MESGVEGDTFALVPLRSVYWLGLRSKQNNQSERDVSIFTSSCRPLMRGDVGRADRGVDRKTPY